MDKSTARVGVLMGGLSKERDVSLKSGKAVVKALQSRGWNAIPIDVGRDLPKRLLEERIDVCWLALHGKFGEDGCVQGLLEVMGIPYTGCGVRASAIAMDKIATKKALKEVDEILMARDEVLRKGEPWHERIPLPLVVKVPEGGSTIGVTIAKTQEQFEQAVLDAFTDNDEVLVEEFVLGDEITVAVLDGSALPVVRIVPDSGFFDFEAKYTAGRTRYEVPGQISDLATTRASVAAVAAYQALGCRGLCRVDFIIKRTDDWPVFLEINTIPGMTETSLSPMAAKCRGIGFEDLVEHLLLGATCMRSEVEPVHV